MLHPFVLSRQLPPTVIYPSSTVMPPGVGWPDVGGDTPALGPLLPPGRRVLHQSIYGPQVDGVEDFSLQHCQLSDYLYLHSSAWD